jgi:hypothetical protein
MDEPELISFRAGVVVGHGDDEHWKVGHVYLHQLNGRRYVLEQMTWLEDPYADVVFRPLS